MAIGQFGSGLTNRHLITVHFILFYDNLFLKSHIFFLLKIYFSTNQLFKLRHFMARKPRIHFSGAFYHVILRGNNRVHIFYSEADKTFFYGLIKEGIERYRYRIHSFCLMDNHIHLVIQVCEIPLSKIIQHLSFRYARYINFNQKRIGHLFQGRYKAILIDAENYLLELVRYVHMNPVRAKMVDSPEDYFWSSHRAYLRLENLQWLTKDFVLNLFNNLEDYKYFISNMPQEKSQKHFQVGNQTNLNVLANDEFMMRISNIKKMREKQDVSLEQIIFLVCSYYSISAEQLNLNKKTRIYATARAKIAWLAKELSVCTFNKVASYFNRDATGLIRAVRNLENRSEQNELEKLKLFIQMSVCQA